MFRGGTTTNSWYPLCVLKDILSMDNECIQQFLNHRNWVFVLDIDIV